MYINTYCKSAKSSDGSLVGSYGQR